MVVGGASDLIVASIKILQVYGSCHFVK